MQYTFRKGKPSDALACSEIIHDWGNETFWMTKLDDLSSMASYWSEVFETDLVWIAENKTSIIGFCVRCDDNIGALYVAKSARSQGVGKKLLDLAKANRDWITVWAYELNSEARKFYRREGLVEISRETVNYEDGVSLVDIEHRWIKT